MATYNKPDQNLSFNIPDYETFTDGSGQFIYSRTPSGFKKLNVQDFAQGLSGNAAIEAGKNYLKSQGLDINSLPVYNMGDVMSAFGGSQAFNALPFSKNVSEFLTQKQTALDVNVAYDPKTADIVAKALANPPAVQNATMGQTGANTGQVDSTLSAFNQSMVNATPNTNISQQDYWLKPGETTEQYNARIVALRAGTTTGGGTSYAVLPNTPMPQFDDALNEIMNNPNLTDDEKKILKEYFDTISTNDQEKATQMLQAFNTGIAYSDPLFKAKVSIVTDALAQGLSGITGDLSYQENQLQNSLNDLRSNIEASKGMLDFNLEQELNNLAKNYEQDLEVNRQNMAMTGKTSSSVRSKAEQLLSEQKEGLVESATKKFSYETGGLERQRTSAERDYTQQLDYLRDKATQQRISQLRQAEEQVGTQTLSNLGYSDLSGGIGGEIPKQRISEALSFAGGSFVF